MSAGGQLSRRIEALDPIGGDLVEVATHPWAEELCREIVVEPLPAPAGVAPRRRRRRRLLAPLIATAALLLVGGGALASGLIGLPGSGQVVARPGATVPSIEVSPTRGPVGTLITVTGLVPTQAPCAYVRLTVGHPAASTAALERIVRPSAGGYVARLRIPSIARMQAVQVVCVASPTSTASPSPSVGVTFRVVADTAG